MDNKNVQMNNRTGNERLHLTVCPTTGGKFQLSVSPSETISGLKCTLAQRLRLRAERMSLLHKEKVLSYGRLSDNQVLDGSRLTLLPNMETGTSNIAADSRVMQALENLTESQVNDFLTGRAPLLLAMKLGEHMMFVHLQLSTSSCSARRRSSFHGPTSPHYRPTVAKGPSPPPPQASRPTCCGAGVPGSSSGAVIDSVNQIGQGMYSGSFSGTLDPANHDVSGKPKRDINTILHILNDLLVASPQLRQSEPRPASSPCHSPPPTYPTTGQSMYHSQSAEPHLDDALRGKVESLQRMMQERRLRRQQKRGMRAPYHWSDRRSPLNQQQRHRSLSNFGSAINCGDREGPTEGHATPPDATFAATPSNIEHESVLV